MYHDRDREHREPMSRQVLFNCFLIPKCYGMSKDKGLQLFDEFHPSSSKWRKSGDGAAACS